MRATQQVTGVLFVAALTAVGCSKKDDPSMKNDGYEARPKQTAKAGQPPVTTKMDSEGFVPEPKKVPQAPLSFSYADGEGAYRAGKYADAKIIFENYTSTHSKNAFGHYMLGLSSWKAGDLAGAEKAFDAALSIDPKHVKSLVNKSRVLIELKRYDDAVDTLTVAGDLDPKLVDVQRLLGRAFHNQKMLKESESAYRAALELAPKDAWSMNNLGLVLLEDKRADEAVTVLTEAVALKGDEPVFHNNLGMALEHTGKFRAAGKAYETAGPFSDKAKQNLARVATVQ